MFKKIPIAVEDFKEIRKKDYYYIDKSKFIEEIFNDGAKVKLFCRPRRFGKTLNMSMLKYFFDMREAEENRKIFEGLYIENSPIMKEQGKYPVVFISFKGLTGDTLEKLMDSLKIKISKLFAEYRDLLERLDKFDSIFFEKMILRQDISMAELNESLLTLTDLLCRYYKQQVIVLIDEYDAPLIYAYEHGYYKEAVDFFKSLYGAVLKTNSNLEMGVLTGAIRVAQAGIFSDLNNLKVNTILDESYDEYFGLLEKEVKKALKDYEMEYKIEEVKSWYNGYRFGNAEVYNPWSIINYIDSKKLKPYWINTSGNILITELLMVSKKSVFESLENLVSGQEKTVYINESIALGNNLSPNSFWELMLFSGYLTVKEKLNDEVYLVKIPNKEVQRFFKRIFAGIVFKGLSNIANMKDALRGKDIDTIINILGEVVLNAMSFHDTNKKYENPYQTLLAGFFYALDDYYEMIPNIETGYGRADIVLKPRNISWTGYILELKRATSTDMEKEAEKALDQIDDKKYDTLLKREGIKDIVKIGLVFDGKKVTSSYFN